MTVTSQYRGKHDFYNPAMSGCTTGAILAMKGKLSIQHLISALAHYLVDVLSHWFECVFCVGGPQAAAVGCASFAAFSVAIETYLHWSENRSLED